MLISAFKFLNKFFISSLTPCSTCEFEFNSAIKLRIEPTHGLVGLKTLEFVAYLNTQQIKGTTKCKFPFSHELVINILKSKSLASIGRSFDILYSLSHNPKFFKHSFVLFSELNVSQVPVAFFIIVFIVAFIISLWSSLFFNWSKIS